MFAEDRVKIRQKLAELCSGNKIGYKKKSRKRIQSYRELYVNFRKVAASQLLFFRRSENDLIKLSFNYLPQKKFWLNYVLIIWLKIVLIK